MHARRGEHVNILFSISLQIRYLQDEVLQIDLSHISPTRVLQGCLPDVANLTEIIAALVCLEWQPGVICVIATCMSA